MESEKSYFINELYLGQIIHVPDDQLLNSYDQRLRYPTFNLLPEQQVFKVEQNGEDIIIPINYLNSEALTVLPAYPELEPQCLQRVEEVRLQ